MDYTDYNNIKYEDIYFTEGLSLSEKKIILMKAKDTPYPVTVINNTLRGAIVSDGFLLIDNDGANRDLANFLIKNKIVEPVEGGVYNGGASIMVKTTQLFDDMLKG